MEIDTTQASPFSSGTVGGGGELTGATKESMGRDDFLKLLMAQLEHQDPMSPVENHEFVAQLATFSSLEQQVLSNQRLEELQLAQMSASNAQLAGFIGKEVTARGEEISVTSGEPEPVGFVLDQPADAVDITVKDSAGRVVYKGTRENLPAGNHEQTWPGTDASGNPLPDGNYTVEVTATGASGEPVGASALVRGIVTGVSFDNGYPELLVGKLRIVPADILSLTAGTGDPATATPQPVPSAVPSATPPQTPPTAPELGTGA